MIKKAISNGLLLASFLIILVEILAPGFMSNWLPLSGSLITLLISSILLRSKELTKDRVFALLLIAFMFVILFGSFWEELGFYGLGATILISAVIIKNSFLDNSSNL